jgi:RNA polymerase sigma-70 factor (ECF subfamily)
MEELVSLRVRDRETLLLYALTDLTYVQVAEALRIPVGTVRSRIARTRKRLEASIGPQMLPEGLKEHFEEGS